jgi:hypothetical protein
MTRSSDTAELGVAAPGAADPELESLPEPRRPGRNLTLAAMTVTALLAVGMAFGLRGEASYALRSDAPRQLGNLVELDLATAVPNSWVHGEALLATGGAVRYGRPLESDSYRLAHVAGNNKLWVQVRVPAGMEGPRFVPPTSFVGRLVPVAGAGIRFAGLGQAVSSGAHVELPADAWLLVDGEAPSTTRWSLGLILLFLGFAAFNVYGLIRLLRPVRDS